RARRDMHLTFYQVDDEAIHDWRKRTKELTYQVELISTGVITGHGGKRRQRLARLASQLGSIIDLMVLEEYVREHATDEEQTHVLAVIERARDKRLEKAMDSGAHLFEATPKRFASKLIETVRGAHEMARQSLAMAAQNKQKSTALSAPGEGSGDRKAGKKGKPNRRRKGGASKRSGGKGAATGKASKDRGAAAKVVKAETGT
ncbi:MAG: CHAD domain-containing protein, partial [Myxococcota bacterium]